MTPPKPFPRMKPDEAREFAAKSREIASIPLGKDGGMGYIVGAQGVVQSIMYMLCGKAGPSAGDYYLRQRAFIAGNW